MEIITEQQESVYEEYKKECVQDEEFEDTIMPFYDWYSLYCFENGLYSDCTSEQIKAHEETISYIRCDDCSY
jgi:hypothetical protein